MLAAELHTLQPLQCLLASQRRAVQCSAPLVLQPCRQCTKLDSCCSLATFLPQVDTLNRFALRPRNAMPTAGGLPGAEGTAGGAAPGGAAGADEQQPDFQGDDAFDSFGGAGCKK